MAEHSGVHTGLPVSKPRRACAWHRGKELGLRYSYENIKDCVRSAFLWSQRPQFLIRLETSLMSVVKADTLVVSIFQTSKISGVVLCQELSTRQHPQHAHGAQLLCGSVCARV